MITLIYKGINDQVLKGEYNKLGRKERTVENMISMAVSRELSNENAMAYGSTSNTAIHTVKSFHNRPDSMSNNKHENKCKNSGWTHDREKCTSRNKTCHKCKK